MKRGGPLPRRTPLRTRRPLAHRGGPLKRSPINPVSDRRRGERDERQEVREQAMRAAGFKCSGAEVVPEVKCWGPLDVDEVVPRGVRPGGHLDPSNVQVLCRLHHEWKHAHPQEAAARGLREWSWNAR